MWSTWALEGLRDPDAARAGVSSEVAMAIQRERCAVCEHFMSRLHISGLDREAAADLRLEQRVNVVGLIPCGNSSSVSNTASEFRREVKLQHVDGRNTSVRHSHHRNCKSRSSRGHYESHGRVAPSQRRGAFRRVLER